jgi:hypothetical protein
MSTSTFAEKSRKRLKRKYHHFGTWRKVAEVLSEEAGFPINVFYPWEFVVKGVIPANKLIQKAFGIPKYHLLTMSEVNAHLAHDAIQDMPIRILAWALKNREPMA